jgi:NMD protein affecting ribosome stability and mRNA decay
MKTKTVRCSNCGKQHQQVVWAYPPYSCGVRECEQAAVEAERAVNDARREEAERDDYQRY